jgi:hypothetical protein
MTKMRPPGQSFRSRRIWASFTTAAADTFELDMITRLE